MKQRVLVAMSGGIDSSVAALLLKELGYEVSGATMHFGVTGSHGGCGSLNAIDDAKRVCDHLNIPHYIFDFAEQLEEFVIAPFLREYSLGRTPNPCITCNRVLKFGSLLERAHALGFDYLATGHYADVDKKGQELCLRRPRDRRKDQTYFLYAIPRDTLGSIIFPLAPFTKDEVRRLANKASLPVAEKKESQDICFISRKNFNAFLTEKIGNSLPGPIIDLRGNVLGKHRGIIHYTIGQRGGLGISYAKPLYVVSIDAEKNTIIVGEKKDVMARGLRAGNVNILKSVWPRMVYAKIRYRKKEAPCTVSLEGNSAQVLFFEEQEAITPGQSVVFYADDCVLGGGIIEEVLHGTEKKG